MIMLCAQGKHTDGGDGDLTAPVRHTAELLWTSASKISGMVRFMVILHADLSVSALAVSFAWQEV